ncbi:MAG: radical SAM protein [Bacteriovoracaceae bacterium]|jgi:radical SAM superfamily enzyme YgiQ (UPF0313 family)|nr:radical SAM protein [Bacteriovoracaceae bacterium]
MYRVPIEYEGRIYRPPSEARSLLIQVTVGCSNNKCTYCAMYADKVYRERSISEISSDIKKAKWYSDQTNMTPQKIFLCDGDALGSSMELLTQVLDEIGEYFPDVRRIGIYATAENILKKTDDELKLLVSKKLSIAYLGMESGNDQVLKLVVKGNTSSDMVDAGQKVRAAGFKLSVIAMLGLGGTKFSEAHCTDTAKAISKMSPEYFSFLTTTPIPGTPYARMSERDSWQKLSDRELLLEMRDIISQINPQKGRIIFRANHVSNLHQLAGILPQDKPVLLANLDHWISECPRDRFSQADPDQL